MTEKCRECEKEFEEGESFILLEEHRATLKEGWLTTGPNSLLTDKIYCTKCWKQEVKA